MVLVLGGWAAREYYVIRRTRMEGDKEGTTELSTAFSTVHHSGPGAE